MFSRKKEKINDDKAPKNDKQNGITMVYGTPLYFWDIYMSNLIIYTAYLAK